MDNPVLRWQDAAIVLVIDGTRDVHESTIVTGSVGSHEAEGTVGDWERRVDSHVVNADVLRDVCLHKSSQIQIILSFLKSFHL